MTSLIHDSITWYINDSLVGTGPSLLHYYFSGGSYTVCAKLVSRSCRAENCQQVMVEGADSCGISPSFGYVADSSNSSHIYFIPVPDSSAYSYLWSFGDGSFSTVNRP